MKMNYILSNHGGVGGGGDSYFNKKIKNISCGGGGGYIGGSYVSLNKNLKKIQNNI